ncbi:hypothetical protein SDC9_43871 [bioreactor metagenome]|uniref:Uncharacterized protein n=1 Tax=bioreactor metagenome TaxID=1076179 RepID=A0A644W1S7_9ZZZZ
MIMNLDDSIDDDDDLSSSNNYEGNSENAADGSNDEDKLFLNSISNEGLESESDDSHSIDDETEENEAVKVNVNIAGGTDFNVISTQNIFYISEAFRWFLAPTEKIKRIFKPGSKLKIPQTLNQSRIVVINGKLHSGKYCLALYLATLLANNGQKIFSVKCTLKSSIFSFLINDAAPKAGIFILRNGFSNPGIHLQDFLESPSELIELLENSNSYLIITNQEEVDLPAEILQIQSVNYTQNECKEIFHNHINSELFLIPEYFLDLFENEKTVTNLISILKTPSGIGTFITAISNEEKGKENPEEYLLAKANDIADSKSFIGNWFEKLSLTEKHFAFTVCLFPNLQREEFLLRYEQDFENLQKSKLEFVGLNQLLTKTNCRMTEWGSFEFNDPQNELYVLNQLKSEYFFHFRKLFETYSNEVLKFSSPGDIEIRLAYSHALGELGKSNLKEITQVVNKWSLSKELPVRAATGYVLSQLCTDPDRVSDVEQLLTNWMAQDAPNQQWTVVAAGERLYSIIPETVITIIDKLSNNWEANGAIIHALLSISKRDLNRVVDLIIKWLIPSDSKYPFRRKIGTITSYNILSKINPFNSRRVNIILPLIWVLLNLHESTCENMMHLCRNWMKSNPDSALREEICRNIAESLTYKNNISAKIISILSTSWINDENEFIYEKAKGLISYYRTINLSNTNKSIVIIVDPCLNDHLNQKKILKLFREIQQVSLSVAKTTSFYMGDCNPFHQSDFESLSKEIPQPQCEYQSSRLIGPILDKTEVINILYVIILSSDQIIDLEDYSNSNWTDKIAVLHLSSTIPEYSGIKYISDLNPMEQIKNLFYQDELDLF